MVIYVYVRNVWCCWEWNTWTAVKAKQYFGSCAVRSCSLPSGIVWVPILRTWYKKLQVTIFFWQRLGIIFFIHLNLEKVLDFDVLAWSIGISSHDESKIWYNYLSSNCAVFCLISFYIWGAQKIQALWKHLFKS